MISCHFTASATSITMSTSPSSSRANLNRTSAAALAASRTRIRKISRTENDEECARLTTATTTGVASSGGGGDAAAAMDAYSTTSPAGGVQDDDTYSYCEYHDLPPPPDGGYGWVIVFASFMCNMIVDGIAYTFGIFIGELVTSFGEGKGKCAWIGSLLSGMYLSAGPVVSAFSNKYGCRAACICGSVISTVAFVLSIFSTNSNMMMISYGFIGGIGFGFIYLPAVVAVSYYFETKRSLATGIAVCGSGVGTFAFAPLATYLLEEYGWRGANLILAGFILNCAVFGALMRPLEYPKESSNCKPLLQRMADEKRLQMERGSIGGSYFIVQMPDGSMEKRMKLPINIDPGVHSSFHLDQLIPAAAAGGTPVTPVPAHTALPTISEVKVPEMSSSSNNSSNGSSVTNLAVASTAAVGVTTTAAVTTAAASTAGEDTAKITLSPPPSIAEEEETTTSEGNLELLSPFAAAASTATAGDDDESESKDDDGDGDGGVSKNADARVAMLPRNLSQPAFTTHVQGIPKNGSVPFFDRIRKTSAGERFRPSLGPIQSKSNSRTNLNGGGGGGSSGGAGANSNGDLRKSLHVRMSSNASMMGGSRSAGTEDMTWSKTDMDAESQRGFGTSRASIVHRRGRGEKAEMVRPMSRKDIFYSGSVTNLPEYQSQKSLQSYRQSIISIPAKYQPYSRERLPVTSEENNVADAEKGVGSRTETAADCSCTCRIPESFKSVLASMLDTSLLQDPVFLLIGVSNMFGMAGLYVPFVYLVDAAKIEGIPATSASVLISIIGITNTIGRVVCGYVADMPWVDSLFLNNICLLVSSISVAATPFCHSFSQFIVMAIFFGISISGYISLTSIILVDLLGLDKLTNAFGLLILFRGAAAIVGSPLAGAVYDATQSYTVPFIMAGAFFFVSACTSFMAPAMKQCVQPEVRPPVLDILTPIDEDDEEEDEDEPDEECDEPQEDDNTGDGGRVTIPQIVETTPSPVLPSKPNRPLLQPQQIESVL